jgi:putative membrane protein
MAFTCVLAFACEDKDAHTIIGKDKDFLLKAGAASQADMIYGQLAAEKGNDPQVRAFGMRMANAHRLAIDDLRKIAQSDNIQLTTGMDKVHEKRLAILLTLVGAPFDTAYVSSQLKNQRENIVLYQSELDSGKVAALRAHASSHLTFMQSRQADAEALTLELTARTGN